MDTTLVILAAGIGSRYGGGIKQLEKVGPNGEIIMDYSIYDALEVGFNKVVFIILPFGPPSWRTLRVRCAKNVIFACSPPGGAAFLAALDFTPIHPEWAE